MMGAFVGLTQQLEDQAGAPRDRSRGLAGRLGVNPDTLNFIPAGQPGSIANQSNAGGRTLSNQAAPPRSTRPANRQGAQR